MLFRATVAGLAISLLFTYFLLLSTFSTCFKALNTHTLCLSRICLYLALILIELFEIAVAHLFTCHMFLHNVIRLLYYCCCVAVKSIILAALFHSNLTLICFIYYCILVFYFLFPLLVSPIYSPYRFDMQQFILSSTKTRMAGINLLLLNVRK